MKKSKAKKFKFNLTALSAAIAIGGFAIFLGLIMVVFAYFSPPPDPPQKPDQSTSIMIGD